MRTTEYMRVIPRDLFNEAKLLKCIGRLCLLIHDNSGLPCKMAFTQDEEGEPFNIGLLEEGSLIVTNLQISIKGKNFPFKTTYNSKANYPLYLEYEYCDYLVFDEQGNFDKEFVDFCETVSESEPEPERPVIKVDNMGNFEFWVGMFKPRTKTWQRAQLKRLKADKQIFGTLQETSDKIKALKFLLQ